MKRLIVILTLAFGFLSTYSQTVGVDTSHAGGRYAIVAAKSYARGPDGNLLVDSNGVDPNSFEAYSATLVFRPGEIIIYSEVMRVYEVIDLFDMTDSLHVIDGNVFKGHAKDPLNVGDTLVFHIATAFESQPEKSFGLLILSRPNASVFFKFK